MELTTADAAAILGVSDRMVRRLCATGTLPATRLPTGAWLINETAVRARAHTSTRAHLTPVPPEPGFTDPFQPTTPPRPAPTRPPASPDPLLAAVTTQLADATRLLAATAATLNTALTT